MKKLLYSLCLLFITSQAMAQACPGVTGGSSTCSLLPSPPAGRFAPYDSFPCIIRGQAFDGTIRFNVPHIIFAAGTTATVEYIRFDTISNLPCGLCWTSNHANNQYNADEDGCIKVSGISGDNVGTYKLNLIMHAKRQGIATEDGPVSAELANLRFYVAVINPGDACPVPRDTAAAHLKQQSAVCPLGINETESITKNLSIVPNPVTAEAQVSFVSEKTGEQQLHIYNMVGREVFNMNIAAKAGSNQVTFNRGNLPQGVYFLSVGEGRNVTTKRFIVAE
ncbi:MAG: T9SS type A sorting domain-containing protein [Chitinophagales bacterium]